MVDVARLGLAVDSSQVEKGTVSLHQLTGAAGQASAAAQRLAGASQAEAAGQKTAAAAVQTHNAALMAQNTIMRSSMHQRTMMIYQLNDVAVSLASGMNPAMVAMQQGSQILQGGLMPAIRTLVDLGKSLVVTFWPVAAVIGAVAAAVAGLTYEINKTADVQVGFFDVALAGWQLLAEQITSWVAPVFGAIGWWLQQGWDAAAPILKDIGNALVGTFVFAFEAIKISWGSLPTAIGDLAYQAADRVVFGVQYMIRTIQMKINEFLQGTDAALQGAGLPGTGLRVGVMWPEHMENPFAGAADAFGSDLGAASSAFDVDYMGNAFGALSKRAQEIASARDEVDALGGSAKAANDNVKKLADDGMTKAFDVAKGLQDAFQGVGKGIFDAFKKGGDVASSVLEMLMGKLEQFATSWLDNIVNNGLNSLFSSFGSFGIGSGMRGTSSITGSSGGFFPAFDGGGYTGYGPRSGGMDGKGGFLAMLHPNETILDHTRGQAANSNRPISVQTTVINNAGVEVVERTTEDGQGGVRQEIILNRAIASAVTRPGPAQKAVRGIGQLVKR